MSKAKTKVSNRVKKKTPQRFKLTIHDEDLRDGLYRGDRITACLRVGWLKPGRVCKHFIEVLGTEETFKYLKEDRTESEQFKDFLRGLK